MKLKKSAAAIALGIASSMLLAGCQTNSGGEQSHFTFELAHYQPANTTEGKALEWWASEINKRSEGAITININYAESLLAAADILSGVANGRADMGVTSYIYHPSELPLSHVVNLPFVTSNMPAQMAAFSQLYEESDAFRAEFQDNGVEMLWWWAVPDNIVGCKEPLETPSDMSGRATRSGGLVVAAMEAVGADVVAITGPEMRDAMERGMIECWTASTIDISDAFGLDEVTPYVYDIGYGLYGAFHVIVSSQVWSSIPADLQEVIKQVDSEIPGMAEEFHRSALKDSCDAWHASDATMGVLSDSAQSAWKSAVGDSAEKLYFEIGEKAGASAEQFIGEYRAALAEQEAAYSDFTSLTTLCMRGEL